MVLIEEEREGRKERDGEREEIRAQENSKKKEDEREGFGAHENSKRGEEGLRKREKTEKNRKKKKLTGISSN